MIRVWERHQMKEEKHLLLEKKLLWICTGGEIKPEMMWQKKPLTSIWSRIRISRLRRNLRTGQDTGINCLLWRQAVICQILFSRIIAILTSIRRVDSWQILRHLLRMAPLIQLIFLTASLRAVLLMGNVMPSVLEAMPLLWFMIRRLQRKLGL